MGADPRGGTPIEINGKSSTCVATSFILYSLGSIEDFGVRGPRSQDRWVCVFHLWDPHREFVINVLDGNTPLNNVQLGA